MRTIYRLLLPALLVLFLAACNNKNKVNLIETTAKDEVPSLGNLSFTFTKNLVPDSLLERWDSTEYIHFDPPIAGRFRWDNPNELIFSPAYELPPATTFKATVTDKLVKYFPQYSIGKCEIKPFYTALLKLNNAYGTWNVSDGNAASAFPQIDLYFNYKVSPDKLKSLLTLSIEGEQRNYNLLTTTADTKISISIPNVNQLDKDLTARIKIAKGLLPERGNSPTDADIESQFVITSPFNLSILDVEANHDGTMGTVKVLTSQAPKSENLAGFIHLSPSVNFKAESSNDGIIITSEEFNVETDYTLTIDQGLKGKIGGTLNDGYTSNVGFGRLEPSISFVNNKGVYLSAKGDKNIEVRLTSVPKVRVIISKIYENNLLAAQRYGYSPNDDYYSDYEYDYEDEGEYYDGGYGSEAALGDIIYDKEIETKNLPRYGNSRLFKFNVDDKLKDFKGIYHIKIRSTEDYWLNDTRFIALSDIGIIAKQGKDKMMVFCNSIKSADALSGVTVTAYGANNQSIGTAVTNSDGVAEFDLKKREFSGFKSALITAKVGNDFNYLPFNTTRVGTSRFDVGGRRNNITNLDAFVYSERDIYRPGEKINFSVIIRDWKWNVPGDVPLKMKFVMPNGKELKSMQKVINEEGSLETQIELSPSALTGSYTFEVYTSNDVMLASKSISVEEFMPDRIKVTSSLDRKSLLPGESTKLTINAMNYFGPPAANRNYELEIQMKEKYFSPEKYSKYDFSLAERNSYYESIVREGTMDEQGNAVEEYVAPVEYVNRGIIQADFFATVFDETGRPVNRKSQIEIFTQNVFYGLGEDGYYYHKLEEAIDFPIIALNKDEKPVTAKAHIQVIKHDYKTVLVKGYSYYRYESQRDDKTLIDKEVTVSGESSVFNFVPHTPGSYEVRIGAPGINSYVSRTFYSYGYWGNNWANSFEVNNEGNVDIELDKEKYLCGEKAKLLFKAPFNGKMLVTVENDKVLEYHYLNVEKRAASLDLGLNANDLPNVYITATLIKPHEESEIPLVVAHGFKSISVEEKSRKIDVQIIADKSVRSRTHQKVKVKGSPNCKITLAAVDEGILAITGYKTPDPYEYFYAKRALEVNSFDLYPLLFPEIKGLLSSTGGDGFDMSKRTNPMRNNRVKLVSYWSGITDANGNGEANFEFDIPQYSGQLRLMAVAYRGNTFGSNELNMTVADPLVISSALPRFLSPKDTVLMPVTISNTTKTATTATANIKLSGPLRVVGSSTQSISIKANSEGRAEFRIVADPKIDVAKVTVEVNGLGEKFLDETDITIRPPASLQKQTDAGMIAAGQTAKVNFGMQNFIPSSTSYQLVVSKNPVVQIADQIYHLVGYPYGCTEQTVSKAFPQLYFGDLSELMNMDKNIKANANYNVQEAIRKIQMRQLYNGAITLWDNEGSENWWATVYAAHFLIEAKKAGFEFDKSLLPNIYAYLITKLKNRETIPYYYYRNYGGSVEQRKIAPREVAYSLYVLALAGKPQVSTMNYYKQNADQLTLDSRYLLSAAYAIAGDRGKYKEMLPANFAGEISVKETGGSFASDVRDEAIALNAILEVDPQNPQIGTMARHISQQLKERQYLSTQERAFSFLALGKIAREANATNIKASIRVNGKEVANNDGTTLKLTAKQLGGSNVEIVTSGSGKLFYFWQAEGISKDGSFKEEDSYIKIRKQFYDRYGRALTANNFEQNDLVIVKLTLEKAYSGVIENIVVTDMLPAGFEIENPRTKEIPGMDWIKDEDQPTYRDVRDDRINLFVNAYEPVQTYYYAVRAVSPGNYIMGPVMADAMYNGEYHSYNGAGIVRITPKR